MTTLLLAQELARLSHLRPMTRDDSDLLSWEEDLTRWERSLYMRMAEGVIQFMDATKSEDGKK